jgi:hypothetical protein
MGFDFKVWLLQFKTNIKESAWWGDVYFDLAKFD